MKRKVFLVLLFLISATALFAYTDNFYSTSTNPEYVALISSIKNKKPENAVLNAYNAYINSSITDIERTRVEYHMARYYRDIKKKDKASEHIELLRSGIDAIDKSTISDFEQKVLEVEYYSAKYYVDKKMSDGIENSNLTKELMKAYPDDVFSIMTDCWRLIYAPQIAGGSPKKALRTLTKLLEEYGDQLCMLDKYSVYCGIAMAHYQRDEYKEADEYFNKAFEYFNKEGDILEAYNDNLKQLKKFSD